MLTVGEWIDKVHEITNEFEHKANEEFGSSVERAKVYREGYVQACEDFGKKMRWAIGNERG